MRPDQDLNPVVCHFSLAAWSQSARLYSLHKRFSVRHMRRRDFIKVIAGSAVAWSLPVRAQQQAMPVIGYLSARSPDDTAHLVAAFRKGLSESGFVEGQNVVIEYRWALGQHDRLPAQALELAQRPVDIIVSTGGESAALAAKRATSTIPIAFIIGGDPVGLGLAASYNQPGGNATGINILTAGLEPKRLGILHQLVPQAETIAVLLNPNFPPYERQLRDVQRGPRYWSEDSCLTGGHRSRDRRGV
jgi:putative tryptophan/tyrosine transport system substrate-binding protein